MVGIHVFMNLQKFTPALIPARVLCVRCGLPFSTSEVFADLDGAAFRSYYCTGCARVVTAQEAAALAMTANKIRSYGG